MIQYSLRTVVCLTGIVSIYASLVPSYGWGRAILCLFTILIALSSLLFYAAAYHSLSEEHSRTALATAVLGVLILSGSLVISMIVFQRPPQSPFEGEQSQVESGRSN